MPWAKSFTAVVSLLPTIGVDEGTVEVSPIIGKSPEPLKISSMYACLSMFNGLKRAAVSAVAIEGKRES